MRRRRARAWGLMVAALALSAGAAAWAQTADLPAQAGPSRATYVEAWQAYLAGHYARALTLAYSGYAKDRARGVAAGQAEALNLIGTVFYKRGDYARALTEYRAAATAAEHAGYTFGLGRDWSSMGSTYYRQGQYRQALTYYQRSLDARQKLGNQDETARALNDLANVHQQLGDFATTLALRRQALAIWQSEGSRAGVASAELDLAWTDLDRGQPADALRDLTAVQAQAEAGDPGDKADYWQTMGEAETALQHWGDARMHLQQALQQYTALGTRDEIGSAHVDLGQLDVATGDFAGAAREYVSALESELLAGNRMVQVEALAGLMHAEQGEQHPELAVLFGKQAVMLLQSVRSNLQGVDPALGYSFIRRRETVYRDLAQLLVSQGRLDEAQQILGLLKLEQYASFTERGDGGGAAAPVMLTPVEAKAVAAAPAPAEGLSAESEQWSGLRALPKRTADQERQYRQLGATIAAANAKMDTYFQGLYRSFGRGAVANQRVGLLDDATSGLQQDLDSHTVALYTDVLDDRLVIVVVTAAGRSAHEVPITRLALRTKVFRLDTALSSPNSRLAEVQAAGRDLYNVLITPIAADIRGADTLVWSMDDVLRYVPVAALYDGQHYVVEQYRTAEITGVGLGDLQDTPSLAHGAGAAFGVSKNYTGLGALPAVPAELDAVVHSADVAGSHGPLPGGIFLNDAFTVTNLEDQLARRPAVVHIASHFFFEPGDDTQSYLLLAGDEHGGAGYKLTLADLRNDPAMSFAGVDLLTLSGCQTALGSNQSDGREIDGLALEAQKKHAQAVMATLWPVADASTAALMGDFYGQWAGRAGSSKAAALQAAQLALLHPDGRGPAGFTHPFYWAPFLLIGNWK